MGLGVWGSMYAELTVGQAEPPSLATEQALPPWGQCVRPWHPGGGPCTPLTLSGAEASGEGEDLPWFLLCAWGGWGAPRRRWSMKPPDLRWGKAGGLGRCRWRGHPG